MDTERITIEPFDLRAPVRYDVVIDRLAWWYYHPREWLKKAALVNDTYLINNPFTFQAMEKHSAYCAMIRLGFDIPATVLVPYKNPVDHEKWAYTAESYNLVFDLDEVASRVGFPMYMKPFDGGAWRGVSRIDDDAALHRAYDESGRCSCICRPRPSTTRSPGRSPSGRRPDHAVPAGTADARPVRGVPRLPAARGRHGDPHPVPHHRRVLPLGVQLLRIAGDGHQRAPIDYANACPDIAITSLHYYFPWAITQLVSWSVFCAVTGRRPRVDTNSREWYDVADDPDLNWADKLGRYALMSDQYFEADTYREFCSTALASLPEIVYEWITSAEFDALLLETVRSTYPAHEQERFLAHFRGLIGLWVADQR